MQAVLETSKIACEIDISTLPGEMIDFGAWCPTTPVVLSLSALS